MSSTGGPDDGRGLVLFIPGLWMHSSSWAAWIDEFDQSGYDCSLFRWPGESATADADRRRPRRADGSRALDLLDELIEQCEGLDGRPVVVGHGVGGWLAEALLSRDMACAAISVSRPPTGWASLRLAGAPFILSRRWAWALARSRGSLPTPADFHRAFANTVDPEESDRLYQNFVIPADARTFLPSALTNRWNGGPRRRRRAARRGPLLLINGGKDLLVPESLASHLHRRYRRADPDMITDQVVLPDRGHSLTIDDQWRSVAFYCLDWLSAHDL